MRSDDAAGHLTQHPKLSHLNTMYLELNSSYPPSTHSPKSDQPLDFPLSFIDGPNNSSNPGPKPDSNPRLSPPFFLLSIFFAAS